MGMHQGRRVALSTDNLGTSRGFIRGCRDQLRSSLTNLPLGSNRDSGHHNNSRGLISPHSRSASPTTCYSRLKITHSITTILGIGTTTGVTTIICRDMFMESHRSNHWTMKWCKVLSQYSVHMLKFHLTHKPPIHLYQ